jgi:hypothetical protein
VNDITLGQFLLGLTLIFTGLAALGVAVRIVVAWIDKVKKMLGRFA